MINDAFKLVLEEHLRISCLSVFQGFVCLFDCSVAQSKTAGLDRGIFNLESSMLLDGKISAKVSMSRENCEPWTEKLVSVVTK